MRRLLPALGGAWPWSQRGWCRSKLESRLIQDNRTIIPELSGPTQKSSAETPSLTSMCPAARPLCLRASLHMHKLIFRSPRLRRSIGVEKVPAGGRVSLNPDHLKPMRKRKRKEYLSPSEEDSDIEGTVEPRCYFSFKVAFMRDYHLTVSCCVLSRVFFLRMRKWMILKQMADTSEEVGAFISCISGFVGRISSFTGYYYY